MYLMTNPNRRDSSEFGEPTLGDALQLLYAVEALEPGVRDITPRQRIEVRTFPGGERHEEGVMIAHVHMRERVGDDPQTFVPVMNYAIVRDSDSDATTTRVVKMPPLRIPDLGEFTHAQDPEGVVGILAMRAITEKARADASLLDVAQEAGMYDLTAGEVRSLTETIMLAQDCILLSVRV